MKTSLKIPVLILAVVATAAGARAQGTAFSYQGRLNASGSPANGSFDLTFSVWDAASGPSQIGTTQTKSAVAVSDGLFTVSLDFGAGIFTGAPRWLEIGVRPAGVGTFTTLNQRQPITPAPYAMFAANGGGGGGSGPWLLNGPNAYYNGGNVGIGTMTPADKLDIRGNVVFDPGSSPTLFTAASGEEQNRYLHLINSPAYASASGLKAGGVLVSDSYAYADPGKNHLVVKGSIGIGTAVYDFSSKLVIDGQDALYVTGFQPFLTMADSSANVGVAPPRRYFQVVADDLHFLYRPGCTTLPCPAIEGHMVIKGNGNVGIGTATPQTKLDVAGTLRTTVLTITGGADIAEPFPMSSARIPKGSVVVIDEENPGHLKPSTEAYDTRVAGVVSGANGIQPGISLHQEGAIDGGENVALSGRVYVQADASLGAIKPGDLLTTSATAGHAMKVMDHTKAQGAILGKAMSGLKQGRGLVLVLVTLQ